MKKKPLREPRRKGPKYRVVALDNGVVSAGDIEAALNRGYYLDVSDIPGFVVLKKGKDDE